MTTWTRTLLASTVALAVSASLAFAQTSPDKPAPTTADKPAPAAADKPGVVIADVTVVTATVEAIDKDKRTVSLKGPRGQVTLQVGPEAKNFDQIKVGDKVKAKYLDSVALFVRKAGDAPPEAAQVQAVTVAPKGQKPKGAAVDTVEISARVEKVDYAKRLITLKGPEGNVRTFKVDQRVKRLAEIKPGDDIVLRHTQAIAIEVVPPKS